MFELNSIDIKINIYTQPECKEKRKKLSIISVTQRPINIFFIKSLAL